ncbi:DUF5686 family protein [Proteiniphilum sp.]|uniref:DUF5686 family protein n=1 Tax=Proteiniphilum sp. TaxID=1926877 RepID=UPI00332D76CA
MKGKVTVYILFLIIASSKSFASQTELPVDTVMEKTMNAAEKYNNLVESFSAEVYTRTYIETLKKNFLYKHTHLIPDFVMHDPKNKTALIETISELRFDYPNNYVQDVQYVTGTLTGKRDIEMIPFELLSINIYGETAYDESFFMPLRFKTSKYYRYNLADTFTENEKTYYSINYDPIYENTKLLKGSFIIEEGTWRVIFFRGEGIDIISNFSFEITMGSEWITLYLPVQLTIYETSSYLGNVVASRHLSTIDYKDIELRKTTDTARSLNISDFFKVRLDSVPIQGDSTFWSEHRPIPLQAAEVDVLTQHSQRQKEEEAIRKLHSDSLNGPNIAQQVQRMAMNSRYKYRSTAIKYSGLFNPLLLGYTSRDGITYRQKVSFNFDLKHNRSVDVKVFGKYMSRRNEFITDLTTVWNYDPPRLGSSSISIGNGTPIYSSDFVEQIQDSLNKQGIDFEDISVNYYRDYFVKLFNTYEVSNGLLLHTGIDYHIRKPKGNMGKLRSAGQDDEQTDNNGEIENMFHIQRSFAPFIRVSWTPRQYYRYDGRQKIYERSSFPTFKLEFSRSFQNIFGSTSQYNRIEFDINQNIEFGLRHSLQYHLGAGKFMNQKTEYFVDFVYFSKNNDSENWNDGLGDGSFNLLSRSLYNAFDTYIQAHVMFETPFLILKNIPGISDFAANERIYLSYLHTPQLTSYTELGYGIGNRFFNAGIFTAFHQAKFREVGVRATLEF